MNNTLIYDNYRRQFINLHGLSILAVISAEILAYAYLIIGGKVELSIKSLYLWIKVVAPAVINISSYFVAVCINKSNRYDYKKKNTFIIDISLFTAAIISIFHREFVASFSSFLFPIFLSGIFNDKKSLNKCLFISLFFLGLNIILAKVQTYTSLESIINYIAFSAIIIVAYLLGYISVDFYSLNLFIIQNQAMSNERLRKKIKLDAMTGLYNSDAMFCEIEKSISIYQSNHTPFCLAVIDIDNFKYINDSYGHNKGDAVLKKTAHIMKSICSPSDCVCRFGGDEFAVILNNRNMEKSKEVLDKLCTQLTRTSYAFTEQKITYSVGLAEYDGKMTQNELFNKADKYMYNAKNNGKNQIYSV